MNENLAEKIIRFARNEDINVIGFGPAEKMDDEPTGFRPEDLLDNTRSLICFGLAVPWKIYHTENHQTEMVWRTQNLFYRRLDTLSLRMVSILENNGEKAVPVFSCFPMTLNRKKDIAGYFNQIRMGEIAGIGTRSRSGLLFHPTYGVRLMLGALVTTAYLPSIRVPGIPVKGCPPDCNICVNACPVKAISVEKKQTNIMRCLAYASKVPSLSKLKFAWLRIYKPESASRLMNHLAFDEHTMHTCSRCITLCPFGR